MKENKQKHEAQKQFNSKTRRMENKVIPVLTGQAAADFEKRAQAALKSKRRRTKQEIMSELSDALYEQYGVEMKVEALKDELIQYRLTQEEKDEFEICDL